MASDDPCPVPVEPLEATKYGWHGHTISTENGCPTGMRGRGNEGKTEQGRARSNTYERESLSPGTCYLFVRTE